LEDAYHAGIAGLAKEPPTEEEMTRARAIVERDELEALQRVAERADRLSMYATLFGTPGMTNDRLPSLLAVTPEQIREATASVIACNLPGRQVGSARLIMEGGIAREPAGRAGVATLAARALTEGTESLDAAAFADAVERLGADISVDAGWDSLQGSVVVPVSRLEPALALLADAVLHP